MGDALGRKTLTSKEAARLLGVSEASVKRWADGGLLPSAKTAGGHRRFRPEDVATFRRAKLSPAGSRTTHSFVAPRPRASSPLRRLATALRRSCVRARRPPG